MSLVFADSALGVSPLNLQMTWTQTVVECPTNTEAFSEDLLYLEIHNCIFSGFGTLTLV